MKIRYLILAGVLLMATGCATVPRVTLPAASEMSLQSLCKKYNIDCRWDGISQTVSMAYAGKRIKAMVGSNIVMVDKSPVALSAPLTRHRGSIIVPTDFEKQVIGPGAGPQDDAQKSNASLKIRRVVVDAGHGGNDPGAIGRGGLKEKDVNLDVARKVARSLAAAGVQVVMTRDTDEFITLQGRTEIASQPGIDLFVSIHANANKSRGANGIEVYYAGNLSRDDQTEDQRRANEKKICSLYNMRSDIPDLRAVAMDMLYAYKCAFSPGLSDAVAQGLAHEVPRQSRGSKPERFFVLRNTLIPAVLVEVGFVTNPKEAALLKDNAFRQRLADSITKSVLRFVYASGI